MPRLVADDGTEMELDDHGLGYAFQSLDIGAPEPRDVVENRSGADGVRDSTRFVGGRAVTIGLKLVDDPLSRRKLFDDLGRFLHPGVRSTLVYSTELDDTPRMMRVRADQWSAPWESMGVLDVSVSFRATEPWATSVDQHQRSVDPLEFVGGRTYDWSPPRTYPAASTATTDVLNEGNVPSEWTARIFGPITNPEIVNLETGEMVAFSGLTVLATEWVELDSAARTVLAGGFPTSSRYGLVDFTKTKWWRLAPGVTRVQLRGDAFTTGAQLELSWHDTFVQ